MQTTQRHQTDSANTIVHLGAGYCRELEDYLAHQPSRLVLVEADSVSFDTLCDRTADLSNVKIVNKAVTTVPSQAILRCFNQPTVNSLHAPSETLYEIYPGLRIVEERQVDTVSVADLIQPLEIKAEQNNWLIIDVAGEEMAVLETLAESRLLKDFDKIRLHCGRNALYENAEPASVILEWLENHYFENVGEFSDPDSDSPVWELQINRSRLRSGELEARLLEQQSQIKQLTSEQVKVVDLATNREQEIQCLTQEREVQIDEAAKKKKQLEQLQQVVTDQKKLNSEQKREIETLKQYRDEHTKLTNQQKSQIDQLTKAKENHAKVVDLATNRQKEIQCLIQEREVQTDEAAKIRKQLEHLKQAMTDQKEQNSELKRETETLKQARDEQTKLANLQKSQIDQSTKAKEDADCQAVRYKQQADQRTKELRDQAKLFEQRQQTIKQLESKIDKMHTREVLIGQEMSKAEGQIELIKDLLLR